MVKKKDLSNENDRMKITRLEVSNFWGLDELTIDAMGKVTLITGANKTGKTSVLEAIREAFVSSGTKIKTWRDPDEPARIVLELITPEDDRIQIHRKITPAHNTVNVKVNGATLSAPQAYLTNLVSGKPFNPVDFFLEPAGKRRNMLLQALDIKLTPAKLLKLVEPPKDAEYIIETVNFNQHGLEVLEDIRKEVYELRANKNRDMIQLNKAVEQDRRDMPTIVDPDRFKKFNLKKAVEEVEHGMATINGHDNDVAHNDNLVGQINNHNQTIKELKVEYEKKIKQQQELLENAIEARVELGKKIDSYVEPDIKDTKKLIADYEKFTELRQALDNIAKRTKRAAGLKAVHKELDGYYTALGKGVPQALLQKAKMPIKDLAIDDDGIKVDGVYLETLSTFEEMEFAIEMARALSTKLGFILVDRLESMDEDNLKQFIKLASNDGFQYVMTQVTRGAVNISKVA